MWKLLTINSGLISLLFLTYTSWFQAPHNYQQLDKNRNHWRVASGEVIQSGTRPSQVRFIDYLGISNAEPFLPGFISNFLLEGDLPEITTRYFFDGKVYYNRYPWYGSDQLSLHNLFVASQKLHSLNNRQPLVQYIDQRYPKGKRQLVYFDPKDPANSLLEPGLTMHARLKFWGYCLLSLVTILLLLYTLKRSFGRRRSLVQGNRRHSLLS